MSFIENNGRGSEADKKYLPYQPPILAEEGFEVKNLKMASGDPLHAVVSDIFYIKSISDESRILPVIPDSSMALVFFGDSESTRLYICGVTDEIKKIRLCPDEYCMFVRFVPGVGASLVNSPACKLTNRAIPLRERLPGDREMLSIVKAEAHMRDGMDIMSRMMPVDFGSESGKYLIKYCTERIMKTCGSIRMEELADETGFTSRYIGKMFERCIGISPKLYSQIIRLRLSMNKIIEERDTHLVDIATDSGFFDHAHMNRMYRKLIHCSSGDFRKNMLKSLDYSHIDDYISAG